MAILWLVVAAVVYTVSAIVYRLTLHPLAKYPGDFIDKISDWRLILDCYTGHRHLRVLELHKTYGSVVRTGANTLSFNTATALTAIYGNRDANVRRADWYKTVDAPSGGFSTNSVIDKNEHAFRRRVLSQAFSEKALRDSEKYIDQNVQTFVQRMGEDVQSDGWTAAKNFYNWATYYGFDFTGNLSFGSSFGLMDSEENRYMQNLLKATGKFLYYVGFLPFVPLKRLILGSSIMNYFPDQTARDAIHFWRLSESKLDQREALEAEAQTTGQKPRKDIFQYILHSRDPDTGLGFTREQLHADANLLIAAGADGVGIALSSSMFYLLHHPAVLHKLVAEIRSSFASPHDIRLPKLNALPYLQAVFDEALRVAPPVPSALPRRVLSGGLRVDGLLVPAGIDVGVPSYAVHHNPAYFPDPWAFRPERWLADPDTVAAARKAWFPFSLGPMNCVGRKVAALAYKLALARLLYVYDVRAAGGEIVGGGAKGLGPGRTRRNEYQLWDWFIGYPDGPMVQFKARTV